MSFFNNEEFNEVVVIPDEKPSQSPYSDFVSRDRSKPNENLLFCPWCGKRVLKNFSPSVIISDEQKQYEFSLHFQCYDDWGINGADPAFVIKMNAKNKGLK